ncbi:substrate-binding domain-containing protein [Burkholderia sp. JSH-S8]|nr:substrate-binding domain-containing protein [Burkholderia sp. JSH-S8]
MNNLSTFFGQGVTGPVHFAISDAALTTYQVTSYNNTGRALTDGPLIQIPYVVTPIAIPVVNAPAVTGTMTSQTMPGQAHSIASNDNDLCGILSCKLKNWNGVTHPETGMTYPPTPRSRSSTRQTPAARPNTCPATWPPSVRRRTLPRA